jgi:predicted acyl esterase
MGPFSCGVPAASTSDYDKFEGPDPAEWCGRGYAIINVDARGAGMSEGNLAFWGLQEAEDIYDAIDWVSKQPWCTGAVGMVGNSWLAISQLNFASRLTHPALKALAPMEAATDMYNDLFIRGGRPHNLAFNGLLLKGMAGSGSAEDMPAMGRKHPVFDEYWESKFINTENVDVPLYLTASYSSGLHTRGSFNTFRNAKTSQKWLRVHPYQEWFDLYRPEIVDDLQRFFDHFCKGVENGWEQDTPPVRLSLMGFENSSAKTIVERPEQEYPLARQMLKSYYLDARTKELAEEKPVDSAEAAHQGHSLTASTVCEPLLIWSLHFWKTLLTPTRRTSPSTSHHTPRSPVISKPSSTCPAPRTPTSMSPSKSAKSTPTAISSNISTTPARSLYRKSPAPTSSKPLAHRASSALLTP